MANAQILNPTGKRAMIDRANSRVVIIASVAAFIFVFSLVATKALLSQATYQNRVISAKRTALKQLNSDVSAANNLQSSYKAFTSTPQNVIGGDPQGSGSRDGDNAKIVLDALPSTYDFPALVTSLEAMLNSQSVTTNSISGNDDEVAQSTNASSATPKAVEMPFQIAVTGNYDSIKGLVNEFEHSIRPIQIQSMNIGGTQDKLTLSVSAQSYYQPAKAFKLSTTVVK